MDKARLQKPSLWCEALPAAWFNHKDGILHSCGHALVAPWPNHWFCLKTIFCDILCVSMVIESQSTVCSRSFIDATWCNLISASCAGWPRTAYALELHRVHYLWVHPRASINDLMISLWATKLILVWGWPTESGSTLSLALTWILSFSCLMFFWVMFEQATQSAAAQKHPHASLRRKLCRSCCPCARTCYWGSSNRHSPGDSKFLACSRSRLLLAWILFQFEMFLVDFIVFLPSARSCQIDFIVWSLPVSPGPSRQHGWPSLDQTYQNLRMFFPTSGHHAQTNAHKGKVLRHLLNSIDMLEIVWMFRLCLIIFDMFDMIWFDYVYSYLFHCIYITYIIYILYITVLYCFVLLCCIFCNPQEHGSFKTDYDKGPQKEVCRLLVQMGWWLYFGMYNCIRMLNCLQSSRKA